MASGRKDIDAVYVKARLSKEQIDRLDAYMLQSGHTHRSTALRHLAFENLSKKEEDFREEAKRKRESAESLSRQLGGPL
jgi:hypothetical protein